MVVLDRSTHHLAAQLVGSGESDLEVHAARCIHNLTMASVSSSPSLQHAAPQCSACAPHLERTARLEITSLGDPFTAHLKTPTKDRQKVQSVGT